MIRKIQNNLTEDYQSAPRSLTRRLRRLGQYLWREWGRPILPIIIIGLLVRGAIADWNDVPTGSMIPTIVEGDRIFVNKLAYGLRVPLTTTWLSQWDGPERGEIVVLLSPADGKRLVKRVVGQPGDVLELRNNRLLINGVPVAVNSSHEQQHMLLDDGTDLSQYVFTETLDQGAHPILITPALQSKRDFGPVTIPEDNYFVMGDNRDLSSDSRVFGFVPRERILGRSTRVVISFDRENWWLPRINRFWHRLR